MSLMPMDFHRLLNLHDGRFYEVLMLNWIVHHMNDSMEIESQRLMMSQLNSMVKYERESMFVIVMLVYRNYWHY